MMCYEEQMVATNWLTQVFSNPKLSVKLKFNRQQKIFEAEKVLHVWKQMVKVLSYQGAFLKHPIYA